LFFPYTTSKAKIALSTQREFDEQLEHDFMIIKICLERRKAIKKRKTYCFEKKKRIKNELTQKKELFDPKCFLTPQFCCGAV